MTIVIKTAKKCIFFKQHGAKMTNSRQHCSTHAHAWKLAGTLAQKIGWRIGQKTGLENSPGNWHRKLIGKWSENHPEKMLENGPRIYQKTTKWQTQIRKMARHAQPWRAITIQSQLWPAMASHGQPWPAMACFFLVLIYFVFFWSLSDI